MRGEYLCARFQSDEGEDCLAIWLPMGSVSSLNGLKAEFARLSCMYSFPVIVVTYLSEGDLRICGDSELMEQVERMRPESLDWRMTGFIDETKPRVQ